MKKNLLISDILASLVLLLFLYTALSKLYNHHEFRVTLATIPGIRRIAIALSWVIPVAELVIAALLLVIRTRRTGLLLALAVLTLFTVYLSYMVILTPDRPCSCGGVLNTLTWSQHILFNLLFIALSLTALVLANNNKKLSHNPP